MLLGPNTGLGHNSALFMIEAQVDYVMRALRKMRARQAGALEVLGAPQQGFAQEMEARTRQTVWKSGCHSWYLDAQGRNVTLWPGFTVAFWWRLQRLKTSDFRWEPLASLSQGGA